MRPFEQKRSPNRNGKKATHREDSVEQGAFTGRRDSVPVPYRRSLAHRQCASDAQCSALTQNFGLESDVDVLVVFYFDENIDLFDKYFDLKEQLEIIFEREADITIDKPFRNPMDFLRYERLVLGFTYVLSNINDYDNGAMRAVIGL